MNKTLVIVESPAKAKTISKYLGRNYKVAASMGHVRDLPKSKMGIDIENDFEPTYITIRGKGEIIDKLKKEAKAADKVYLATDPDREGEAISWHLAQILNINPEDPCRIEFNEITKNTVRNAVKNPRAINHDLVNAQQARRVLDRLVGYLISPLLWENVKYGLSAGRVQSVAVRIICDRENEIKEFKPEEYWTITNVLSNGAKVFEAKFYGTDSEKIDLKNQEQVNEIIEELKNAQYVVTNVKRGEKKRNPAPPFTTSTLQQEASRKYGFTAKKTMLLAQQLYEGVEIQGEGSVGLITYIRTDSTRLSDDAKNEAYKFIQEQYGSDYAGEYKVKVKTSGKIQDAHEAIRPTSVLRKPEDVKSSLSRDQYRLYKLIWDRFVASQMAPAVYDTLTVDIKAGKYLFRASGSTIRFPGFMHVYLESTEDAPEEDNSMIPELKEGDILKLIEIRPQQHFTQPPPRYTEASLIKTLEEKGIGRPSTYAPIISTIQERGYVVKEGKVLVPTELGYIVNDIMLKYFKDIVDIGFTADMESKLDAVESGQIQWKDIIREFYERFSQELNDAKEKMGSYTIQDEETDIKCELCGRNMVIKHGRYGKFLACPGYPECKNTKPFYEEAGVACPECGGRVLIKKTRRGRTYYGCENNPTCGFMTWDRPTGERCPKCGGILVEKELKGEKMIRCSNKNCDYQGDIK
ncbi:DNA topoisomerase-1 [Caldanaerobius fijiensis DSM 17918]|uniref:DNA topoisomerase 1 n=1 Tax=Caldanaerobius fijiensis DSM 17918 TaxID=1121256 RepID=A0A1M4XPX9_9THEO|nr:type I DNA topoisomerase [Caldanaerobius fijiensis]SHE95426.1 DNA topoisomerase-1 [Caldanaerobius fijiensis DSM 17918]